MAPAPGEAGFKETVKANPGQVTVVRAKFALPSTALNNRGQLVTPQKYVHHCHIVEHTRSLRALLAEQARPGHGTGRGCGCP